MFSSFLNCDDEPLLQAMFAILSCISVCIKVDSASHWNYLARARDQGSSTRLTTTLTIITMLKVALPQMIISEWLFHILIGTVRFYILNCILGGQARERSLLI